MKSRCDKLLLCVDKKYVKSACFALRIPAFKVMQYSLILSTGGNASFSSYEPVLPIHRLTALNLGAGVEQPFDCRHPESSGYAEVDARWIGQ